MSKNPKKKKNFNNFINDYYFKSYFGENKLL